MAFDSFAQVIKQESLSCTTTVPEFTLGARHHESGNEYVYVYNGAANSKITTGQPAVLQASSSSLTSGYTVTVTNAASQVGFLAIVAQNTFATGTYGFGLVKGVSLVALDASEVSMNVGDYLALGVDGGFVARSAASLSTSYNLGVMLNSGVTTVGTGKARIFGSVL